MRTRMPILIACLLLSPLAASSTPNPASTAFARAANSPAGEAAFDVDIAATPASETWRVAGQDVVPFYYEQGMAHADGELVFASRLSLTRTAVGCPDPLDADGPCYDVREENLRAVGSLASQGFNHIGGIDIGGGLVFAPLETENPRTRRGYAAYDLNSLERVGLLVEPIPHKYNSWVAVDPTARYVITSEGSTEPFRVYEVARSGGEVTITRREELDVATTTPLPNFQGCKFDGPTTLYCANWAKRDTYFDIRTEIYRVDLSKPVGERGATAQGGIAVTLKAQPNYVPGGPYGLETEDLAFWGGQLHVTLRSEALGWIHVVHLERTTGP